MTRFRRLAEGILVDRVLAELDARPDLWAANADRITGQGPHRETQDIWVRYRKPAELTGPDSFREPHLSVWYPAWHAMPSLRPIVFALQALVGSVHLGGVLLTRIPAGASVFPHHDRGSWHSEYHNAKVWVPLRANDRCLNHCEEDSVVMRPGEAWTFDNLMMHSVENRGRTERIVLIICMRAE